MSVALTEIDQALPAEYRGIAADLYAALAEGGSGLENALLSLSASMGVSSDYAEHEASERRILGHFRNNVELLIQKTWVEKADEAHKEKLLDRVPTFLSEIEKGEYRKAVPTFVHMIDELGYLLFGAQGKRADFVSYTFRIDPQLGLFWWYAANLGEMVHSVDESSLKPILYVGICYLSCF